MGIQDQCLGRESPTCLFPGPRFLEITFYQLLRTIPPANLSHHVSFKAQLDARRRDRLKKKLPADPTA
ncbi:hypothetical protein AMECASPLE_003879 [Ameca splendens]|uniref:Uncharacterized protein n=1 Tax=Ameca splendens TaxID=208324 RepID=A0ABV0XYI0_9TELE